MKKNKQTGKFQEVPKQETKQQDVIEVAPIWTIKRSDVIQSLKNEWYLYVCLVVLFFGLYFYSFISTGFYQGEEGAHYINMKKFWTQPSSILGNWAKTGWKIIYAIPALEGKTAIYLLNCFFSCLTAFFTYKVVQLRGGVSPILSVFLLFCGALWFGVSFRIYSEISAACLLMAWIYFHYKKMDFIAAILLSYVLIIRQEMYIVAAVFGLYLLWNKNYNAFLILGLFPFLNNLWGWIEFGDIMYLYNDAKNTAAQYSKQYTRAGFDHYFKMSGVCFGYFTVLGIVLYTVFLLAKKRKVDLFLFAPFYLFFLLDCLFNLKAKEIGTSTAGNLRYMLIIAPMGVALANLAFDQLYALTKKYYYLFLFVPMLGLYAYFFTYDHNWIERAFWLPRIYTPLYISIVFVIFLMLPIKIKWIRDLGFIALCIVHGLLFIRPIILENRDENSTCKEIAGWVLANKYHLQRPIYQNMAMFNYFMDMTEEDYPKGLKFITPQEMEKSPIGSIVIWDGHFAGKYSGVDYKYFEDRPELYLFLKQWNSPDGKFMFVAYERVNK
ncbi:MAG TPA: hypothetical protein PK006_04960 [Saprospiraceae bacterium]|nr:hypothetical protein [Saprospiraceae bacterium]